MRSGRGIAVGSVACAMLLQGRARAQDAHVQGVFSGSIGVTDNVSSAPEPTTPEASGPEADGFGTVSPGVVFGYDTPRTSQTLSYTFTANFFLLHPEANSYTNLAAYTARFVTSPTTSLTLGATGSQGQLNTFQLEPPPGTTAVQVTPGGTTNFVQAAFNEGFSKQFSPVLSFGQAASFLVYNPLQDRPQRTYSASNILSLQRLFQHDVAALALTAAYTHFDNVPLGDSDADGADEFEARDQLLSTLVASWQHDYGRGISSQLDLGATHAADLSGAYAQRVEPVGLAAARYVRAQGEAELAYSHAAAVNVFLQQVQFVDQLTLRAAVPVSHRAHLSAEGSAGLQFGRSASESGGPSTRAVLADLALLWSPVTPIPEFGLALRYQHTNQLTTQTQAPLPDAPDQTPVETRTHQVRNALILTVSGAFPASAQTSTRILMTQPFGSSGPESRRRQQAAPPPEESESETFSDRASP